MEHTRRCPTLQIGAKSENGNGLYFFVRTQDIMVSSVVMVYFYCPVSHTSQPFLRVLFVCAARFKILCPK